MANASYHEFLRREANKHEFRAWSQQTPFIADVAFEDEIPDQDIPLPDESLEKSKAAIVDPGRFIRVLESVLTPAQIQAVKDEMEL